MKKKPRFNPEITRVKLNPEQAVLFCSCYTGNLLPSPAAKDAALTHCLDGTPRSIGGSTCRLGGDLAAS